MLINFRRSWQIASLAAPWLSDLSAFYTEPRGGAEYEFYSDDEDEEDEVAPTEDPRKENIIAQIR